VQHLSEEDIMASTKNGKTTDVFGASDTGTVSEDDDDDCCEVVIPQLRRVQKMLGSGDLVRTG
jgi:hypothetical protein